MGVVYRAIDSRLKRPVALKMIRPDLLSSERLNRFRIEAEALARLQHPHIVQVHAWEEHDRRPVLVLEYVAGGSLEDRLGEEPLAPREAARLVAMLARAVAAAHRAGVVHRDLKPANVLMADPVAGNSGTLRWGFPRISDFGLAQLADHDGEATLSGMVMGTPTYMAPEQAAGRTRDVGRPADVWALGVILYRCLTGEAPFRGTNALETVHLVLTVAPARPSHKRAGLPAALEAVCMACLDKEPGRRPTAEKLADWLDRFLADRDEATKLARPRKAKAPRPVHDTARLPARREVAGQPSRGEPKADRPTMQKRRPRASERPSRRWLAFAGVGGAAVLLLAGLLTAAVLHRRSGSRARGPGHSASAALRVESLRVRVSTGGVLGENVFLAHPGDGVRIEAELSAPGHAYVLAFGPDSERLLWPVDANQKPDPSRRPPRQAKLLLPLDKGGWLPLPGAGEGMHAFAVVASSRPLPAYSSWLTERRPVNWHRMPPARHLIAGNGESVTSLWPEGGQGPPPPGRLMGDVEQVLRSLRSPAAIETVRLLAVPVRDR
jgi:serine/threonine protein kinase